jgi:hypothetical protein
MIATFLLQEASNSGRTTKDEMELVCVTPNRTLEGGRVPSSRTPLGISGSPASSGAESRLVCVTPNFTASVSDIPPIQTLWTSGAGSLLILYGKTNIRITDRLRSLYLVESGILITCYMRISLPQAQPLPFDTKADVVRCSCPTRLLTRASSTTSGTTRACRSRPIHCGESASRS